ncbi:MAG: FHA domain-containing protein [Paenibacillaceae bacterium]|nr:FHA domain-containing protein [Paenibacillaceae bacterium]
MQWAHIDIAYEHSTTQPEWTLTIADERALVHTPLRMVMQHAPHGFVPVRLTYVATHARLHYDVTGLRKLEHVLRDGLDRKQWESLIASLAQRVQTCSSFLIDESELLLHPEYVYTARNEVVVACVPLRTFAHPSVKWAQWQAMCASLKRYGCPHDIVMRMTPDQWDETTFAHALWAHAIQAMPQDGHAVPQDGHAVPQDGHAVPQVSFPVQEDVPHERTREKGSFWQSCLAWMGQRPTGHTALQPAHTATAHELPMHERTTMMADAQQTTLLGGMRPLIVHVHVDDDPAYALRIPTSPFVVGREDADHVIPKRSISRKHVVFSWVAGQWTVRDCGSVNGSWHNDRILTDDRALPFVPGDIVRIPGATLTHGEQ